MRARTKGDLLLEQGEPDARKHGIPVRNSSEELLIDRYERVVRDNERLSGTKGRSKTKGKTHVVTISQVSWCPVSDREVDLYLFDCNFRRMVVIRNGPLLLLFDWRMYDLGYVRKIPKVCNGYKYR